MLRSMRLALGVSVMIVLALAAGAGHAQMFGKFMAGGPTRTGALLLVAGGSNFLLLSNGSRLCLSASSSC